MSGSGTGRGVAAGVLMAWATWATAATIHVPGQYATIQGAVDAASNGDEVLVAPGTYTGTGDNVVNLLGKSISLRSSGGASQTSIDGQSVRRGIMCGFGETPQTLVEGFTITNCKAIWFDQDGDGQADVGEDDGGGIACWSSSPTITDCVITSNLAPSSGGGMFCSGPGGSSPAVTNCTFSSNSAGAGSGGGLYAGDGDPVLVNCSFVGNTSAFSGGGIQNSSGSLTLTNCSFRENSALNGGGMSNSGCEASLTDCAFENNQATDANFLGGGGGLRNFWCSPLLINCTFVNNSARNDSTADYNGGGAVHCWSTEEVPVNPVFRNCTFTGNSGHEGGAILCYSNSPVDLENCLLTGNVAVRYGGGIYCREDSRSLLTGCTVADNSAGDDGGGVYTRDSDGNQILNCEFTGNQSGAIQTGSGGGLYCRISTGTSVTQSTFRGNSSTGSGGGMYVYGWQAVVADCEFDENHSAASGGGLYFNGSVALDRCDFSQNTADDSGGGLYNHNAGSSTFNDCTWINNQAESRGGGLRLTNGDCPMTNCRVTNNTSAIGGGIVTNEAVLLAGSTVCRNEPTQVDGDWSDNGGNWVGDTCPAGDCNGNGTPDEDDVADGYSLDCDGDLTPDECESDCDLDGVIDDCDSEADIDGNGVPDNCDPDCNGNGLPDAWDVSSGNSADCQGDGQPDDCQLLGNDCNGDLVPDDCQVLDNDCNGNGNHDDCDISGGGSEDQNSDGIPDECQDCNDNGVLDPTDIAQGTSADCQGNGIPDECEYGDPTLGGTYALDDGEIDAIIGFPDLPMNYAWFNQFEVEPGSGLMGGIEVAWGSMPWGNPAKVVLWSDPDGDGDPADAQLLVEVDTTIESPHSSNGSASFVAVTIPPTYIGPAGTSFFAGAFYADGTGEAYPVPLDLDAADGRSWWASSPGVLDLDDLAGTAEVFLPLPDLGFDADLLVRVRAIEEDNSADCNANGILDACEIVQGEGEDCNGDWVLDQCQCFGDVDSDGQVDHGDLMRVIDTWGTAGDGGDLDCSGTIGVADLLLVLSRWQGC